MTIDEAYRALGAPPDADREELRAAFRRRMMEMHPDASGDDSAAGQASARDVIEAYRQLCDVLTGQGLPRPASGRLHQDGPIVPDEASTTQQRSTNSRLVQVAVGSVLVFGAAVLVLFFLVAFSQSGG